MLFFYRFYPSTLSKFKIELFNFFFQDYPHKFGLSTDVKQGRLNFFLISILDKNIIHFMIKNPFFFWKTINQYQNIFCFSA
jgi:hypothetical protein